MTRKIRDLATSFADLIANADETTATGCKEYCEALQNLEKETRQYHLQLVLAGQERLYLQTKRLLEAILGILQYATTRRVKLDYEEWKDQGSSWQAQINMQYWPKGI